MDCRSINTLAVCLISKERESPNQATIVSYWKLNIQQQQGFAYDEIGFELNILLNMTAKVCCCKSQYFNCDCADSLLAIIE